jgi:hypothetical protein
MHHRGLLHEKNAKKGDKKSEKEVKKTDPHHDTQGPLTTTTNSSSSKKKKEEFQASLGIRTAAKHAQEEANRIKADRAGRSELEKSIR